MEKLVRKPMLTVGQQIAHLKAKGVTFDLCSEERAAHYLRTKCQFFRIYAYRKSFSKYVGGKFDGKYMNLDFGYLKTLSNLDRMLRDLLLSMTLDIEHFAKVSLLRSIELLGEDGYSVIRDYLSCLSKSQRSRLNGELLRRRGDPYAGALICKYESNWPIWAFCEVVSFGTFVDLFKFCADRWGNRELLDVHYQLKNVKQVRNASAHGACILNEIAAVHSPVRAPSALVNEMNACGISRRLRTKWLRSRRMMQICSLFYLYVRFVPSGSVLSDRKEALALLFDAIDSCGLPEENPDMAALSFLQRLTRCLGLLE